MSKNTTISVGPGFSGLLTLLFIYLKLTHAIAWPWFWVLSPFIFTAGLALLIIGLFLALACVAAIQK